MAEKGNILFDYSYKYFYDDGYGKNAFILNMPDGKDEDKVFEYLCGNLLKLVQQHAIYAYESDVMASFNIEKPLLMFVGNTVTGTKEEAASLSDVQTVVRFFASVLNERKRAEQLFGKFMRNEAVLVNANGFNLLDQAFTALTRWCDDGKAAYELMLKSFSTAPRTSGSRRPISRDRTRLCFRLARRNRSPSSISETASSS